MRGRWRSPLLRRIRWYVGRIRKTLDARFFFSLFAGLVVVIVLAAVAVTLAERNVSAASFGESVYWAVTTVIGQGDSGHVTTPAGWIVAWLLGLFGVGIFAAVTGAMVGFVIDFILKEGQGMGAAGYEGHIVVCGWNATARDLLQEFRRDEYDADVVVVHETDKNPAGDDAYFVRGDATDEETLRRAGIEHAAAAIVFPVDTSDASDMRSILVTLAIESIAPDVRTIAEVNNPKHVTHFERAHVDEVMVTTRLASHLVARSAMYPGLTTVVEDLVSGGDGSELYRVRIPSSLVGLTIDDLSKRVRGEHQATLLAVARDGRALVNPRSDMITLATDDIVVVANSLGSLRD